MRTVRISSPPRTCDLMTILPANWAVDHARWGGLGTIRTTPGGSPANYPAGCCFGAAAGTMLASGAMKRILLVDDDAASRNATSAILRDLDCVVEIATDGNSALRRLRRAVPDAVLVGLNIPEMSGGA